jgi:hypothetical protein
MAADRIRVADIRAIYEEWSAKGAQFLTEPKDHGREIRAYIRDPDGHLIEVGGWKGSHRVVSAERRQSRGPL